MYINALLAMKLLESGLANVTHVAHGTLWLRMLDYLSAPKVRHWVSSVVEVNTTEPN